jgi:transcriptional regulator with GAF, ATPase, and Fis domain
MMTKPLLSPDVVQSLLLDLAGEHSTDRVLAMIPDRLAASAGVALARIWLLRDGDICSDCPAAQDCPGRVRCLHLVASAGTPLTAGENWSRLDGDFRRFPSGVRKVGEIAATGAPLIVNGSSKDAPSVLRPDWAKREKIVAFGGQPLQFHGEILGVLALFLRAPFAQQDLESLRTLADHAAATLANARAFEKIESLRAQLETQNALLREDVREAAAFGSLLGNSRVMARLSEQIALVAPTDATVLVTGESGTGKELVVRELHARSAHSHAPLVRVNCAAIPAELYESEFFGHTRGAFTGAARDQMGRFAAADGGTLFLDEVGEIPIALQAKLLRAIEEGEYERVGDPRTHTASVRIIAATHRDLTAAVRDGTFRQDLYYRLDVFPIEVPPLRDRLEDVPALAEHFLNQNTTASGVHLSDANRAELQGYDWPGNVRELRNVIERAAIVTRSGALQLRLRGSNGPSKRELPAESILTDAEITALERKNLVAALTRSRWRVYGPTGAAVLLGIKPTTLISRMKRLQIEKPRY